MSLLNIRDGHLNAWAACRASFRYFINLWTSSKEQYKGTGAIRITFGFLSSHTTPRFISSVNTLVMLTENDRESWAPLWLRSEGVRISTYTCFAETWPPLLLSVSFWARPFWTLSSGYPYCWIILASKYPVSRRHFSTNCDMDVFWNISRLALIGGHSKPGVLLSL